ncbi:Pimeloyl-ACP methyl ester carboxylesterase [Pseudomonas sp. URIL14HWK12:I9]|nr:pimeloyl-ACP methyl ester carboxylesterase [Pseudomonas sp. URIL14HWK12:I12]PVZ27331.1 pimeloyl-ACP methyl ester carboxylesterase [Pseudomonas sp. URIL14HWK12:I10]PVZ38220.1 pimeloyl-ACP methyl ester carboxylesterase [Pseudomonas sp. URIL14HWK12:I11]SNZ04202.1 Pimeloyl-ACP methyl ester carboxylesterase [Pseudomonas sp. URIL14HWK12:I9]
MLRQALKINGITMKKRWVALLGAFMMCWWSVAQAAQPVTRFSVEVSGQGPDVILIPGLGSGRAVWDGLAAQLQADHRVHRVQLAGFAGEPWAFGDGPFLQPVVEDLARYIRQERLNHPAVIGHSMGGLCGLMLAQAYPDDVGRLMTVDTLPFYSALFGAQTVEDARPAAERARQEMLALDDATFSQRQARVAQGLSLSPFTQAQIVGWAQASDRHALAAALRETMLTDVRPGLAAMQLPVTALYADAGRPADEVDALWAAQYQGLVGLKRVRVRNSYHFIMADQPQVFAEAVQRFLAPAP